MTRRRPLLLALVVCATLLLGHLVLLPQPGGVDARWFVDAEVDLPSTRSDTLSSSATDATTGTAPGTAPNAPAVSLAAGPGRQTALADVTTTRVTLPAASPGSDALLGASGLRYRLAPPGGTCAAPVTSDYWSVGGAGAISPGVTYTRTGAVPAGSAVGPGATRQLCPQVVPTRTGDALFLTHGGRALDVQTGARITTQAPATWSTATSTATSRYRVGFPAIGPTAGAGTCMGPGLLPILLGGGVVWEWPSAAVADGTATPAVWRWQIRYRPVGSTSAWSTLDITNPATRAVHYSALTTTALTTYEVVVRAYPFPGDTSRYVDAVSSQARRNILGLTWVCPGVLPGTGGPVNMP